MAHPRLSDTAYVITLTRAHAGTTEVWAFGVRDPFPCVPVPLLPADDEVILDLPAAFAAIYDEAGYDLSIDYTQPPPPPHLAETEEQWMRALLHRP